MPADPPYERMGRLQLIAMCRELRAVINRAEPMRWASQADVRAAGEWYSHAARALHYLRDLDLDHFPLAYFFGCWDDIGHHLRKPSGAMVGGDEAARELGPDWRIIDGGLVAWDRPSDWLFGTGRGRLHGDWTYLARSDNTIDKRHGSHSTFLIEGIWGLREMSDLCWYAFPRICARVGLERFP